MEKKITTHYTSQKISTNTTISIWISETKKYEIVWVKLHNFYSMICDDIMTFFSLAGPVLFLVTTVIRVEQKYTSSSMSSLFPYLMIVLRMQAVGPVSRGEGLRVTQVQTT